MRYKLLDTFAGAGGAAMGYSRAGFDVYGIDNDPKPLRHYPFPYICMDALEALDRLIKGEGLTFSNGETLYLKDFAAFHASPPCQAYSCLRVMQNAGKHPRLIEPVRDRLQSTGKPYVIENVPGAPLLNAFALCGSSFGLLTNAGYQIRRHRIFETNIEILLIPPCQHSGKTVGLFGNKARDTGQEKRHYAKERVTRGLPVGVAIPAKDALSAMGTWWMNIKEGCQAIPPAYTEYIGRFLAQHLEQVKD